MPVFSLYAEYCWNGQTATPENAWAVQEFITKVPKSVYDAMDAYNFGLYGNHALGRRLVYQDVFETVGVKMAQLQENMPEHVFQNGEPMKTMRKAAAFLEKYVKEKGDWRNYFAAQALILRTAASKAEIHAKLFRAYKKDDTEELRRIAEVLIPETILYFREFYKLFQMNWLKECKPFGWECHCMKKGFQLERLHYARDVLTKYLNGELVNIEELEVEQLNQNITVHDTSMFD